MFNTVCFKSGRQYPIAGQSSCRQARPKGTNLMYALPPPLKRYRPLTAATPAALAHLQRVHLCSAVTHPAVTTLHRRDNSAASTGAPENLLQRRPTPVSITMGKHHKHAPSARTKEERFLQKIWSCLHITPAIGSSSFPAAK